MEDFILLDDKNFQKKHRHLHPWTKRLLEHIVGVLHLQPVKCELGIYDEEARIGTRIDMVCVEPLTQRIGFIEIKTGYRDFESYDGYMQGCLACLQNSALNRASIQLATSVVLALKHNPSIALEQTCSHVIRVDEENLDCYAVENKFIRLITPSLLKTISS